MDYRPKKYWEKRLSDRFNLSGVGHIDFNKYYNKWIYKAKLRALDKVLLQHTDIRGKTICDFGCGTGFFVNYYNRHGARDIVGIDITKISIQHLQKKYSRHHFVNEDISYPYLISKIDKKFDIINVFDVLYHITDDRAFTQAITNISGLAKDNGLIFISDLYKEKNISVTEHVRFRNKEIYDSILGNNKLEIIETHPIYFFLNNPIFGSFKSTFFYNIGIKLDNIFAPIYYYLDSIFLSSNRNNLNLLVIKKSKE